MRAACALRPGTPVEVVLPLLDAQALDMVLVLSVEPGFGGQSFKPEVLPKVSCLLILVNETRRKERLYGTMDELTLLFALLR